MKKFPLAALACAVASANVNAFQVTSSGDWDIRWDNTVKANVMSRVAKPSEEVYGFGSNPAFFLADDSTLSVDRKNGGIVSARLDLLTELDVIYKEDFGFRISASGWYDRAYRNSDHPSNLRYTWASPSVQPGQYNEDARDLHYKGGEILDAFVFANFDLGETSIGVRAGRHTIYWGNSLLAGGAIASIGGSMAPIDFSKAFSVPGTDAKELFMPTTKISTVWQLSDNLTLNAYYGFEHRRHRLPETGTYFSPAEGLSENTEFITFPPGSPASPLRTGLRVHDDAVEDNEWGVNFQYYFEDLALEASFIYLNYVDKNLHGLHGGFNASEFALAQAGAGSLGPISLLYPGCNLAAPTAACPSNAPDVDPAAGTVALGDARWLFKDDIDLFGLSFSKEIAGISAGLDISYRRGTGIAPSLASSLTRLHDVPASALPQAAALLPPALAQDFLAYDSANYIGPVGDTVSVVVNALGLLSDNGIWEGGSYIIEGTFAMLEDCTANCDRRDMTVEEDRIVSALGVVFKPTWYQVLPGWDMSVPVSASYTFNDKSPFTFGGDGERGNASVGVEFNIEETWNLSAKYNAYFGPVNAGIGGRLKDRDNVSLTLKRTF